MVTSIDFLEWLESDMSMNIMMCLVDVSDLVRASSVSRLWRHFVIANGLCKQLCLRLFPQLTSITDVSERIVRRKKSVDVGSSKLSKWEILERDHRIYSSLCRALNAFELQVCIIVAISASSTDNYPRESIVNTVGLGNNHGGRRIPYWSSKGQKDPNLPEVLVYKLVDNFCAITEIKIRPFQAYFQFGLPIYSAKWVRFRIGHPKCPIEMERNLENLPLDSRADDFFWTYTSPDFPMAQESKLQAFTLPEPVICMGGYMQIELFGRVQTQEMDNLYYICVSNVEVIGRSLYPAFSIDVVDAPAGKFGLRYDRHAYDSILEEEASSSDYNTVASIHASDRMRGPLEDFLQILLHGVDSNDHPL